MAGKWRSLFPEATRNKADFFLDGEETFAAMIKAIESVRSKDHYVYILGWTLDICFLLTHRKWRRTLYKALSEADERGAEIRILVWDNPVPEFNKPTSKALKYLNNHKEYDFVMFLDDETYFPERSKKYLDRWLGIPPQIRELLFAFIPRFTRMSTSYLRRRYKQLKKNRSLGAHHEKLVIVKGKDGLVSFCGGIDFHQNRISTKVGKDLKPFPFVHDTACRIEGPAAHDILAKFIQRWRNHRQAKDIELIGEKERPPSPVMSNSHYVQVVGTYNNLEGEERDRSLKKAYLSIVEKAERYVYIEDQYLVNLDVAKILNEKIQEPNFQFIMLVVQDSDETEDILIPNRRRKMFVDTVLKGVSGRQAKKLFYTVVNKRQAVRNRHHTGMHAKTLIVDDEIAIIGSGNLSQRSFTLDSETSVVVFDDRIGENWEASARKEYFAFNFRVDTWHHSFRPSQKKEIFHSWLEYPTAVTQKPLKGCYLRKYVRPNQSDLDVRLTKYVVLATFIGKNRLIKYFQMHPLIYLYKPGTRWAKDLMDQFWEYLIDPKVD